jgi:hypothetical protein
MLMTANVVNGVIGRIRRVAFVHGDLTDMAT